MVALAGPNRFARTLIALALAAGAALFAPEAGFAEVDPDSATTSAEILAGAENGDGGQDLDSSTLSDFTEFVRTVSAVDSNGGRSARASGEHDTKVLVEDGLLLGVDSRAIVDASVDDGDGIPGTVPRAGGGSSLTFGFDVVDEPVEFSLNGTIEVFGSSNACAAGVVSGIASASITACPGGPVSAPVDLTGTLEPGTHELEVGFESNVESLNGSSEAGTAQYDLQLRFCTITMPSPGGIVNGTPGDDVICGSSAGDTIGGGGGDDRIFGLGGDDVIEGGGGDDKIDGGDGDDIRLYGGTGDDQIDGGPGDDGILTGDIVAGGPGDDELDGGPGNDVIAGRCGEGLTSPACPGDPPIPGESDFDEIDGGEGNDSLHGDLGSNILRGGSGDDTAVAGEGGGTIELGKGDDNAIGSAFRDEIDGGPGDDGQLLPLLGGGAADEITGGTGDDILGGDAGSDDLFGGSGSDKISGNKGNDCLVGGKNKDVLKANAGDDTIIAKDSGRDTGSGGPGPDEGRFDPSDDIASVAFRKHKGGC